MKAIVMIMAAVMSMAFLATVAADELYPVNESYEHAAGTSTIKGEVISLDKGSQSLTVQPTDISTQAVTISIDKLTKVRACNSGRMFEDLKVGESVEVRFEVSPRGSSVAEDVNVINVC